jgi:hypothetical protein
VEAPHGTTIVAVTHASGVVMAGDRRATMGNIIAPRDIEKVFQADDDSATGGPDLTRRIWPVVMSVTDEGVRRLPDDEVGDVVQAVVDERMVNPGG